MCAIFGVICTSDPVAAYRDEAMRREDGKPRWPSIRGHAQRVGAFGGSGG